MMRRMVAIVMATAVLGTLAVLPASASTARSHIPSSTAVAVRIGPLSPTFHVEIALVLRGQQPGALSAYLAAQNDRRSPLYHHYLSLAAFAQRFGPSAADEAHVAQILRAAGLRVEDSSAASSLVVAQGTAGAVEALFDVTLDEYRAPNGTRYYTSRAAAHLPVALAASVSGVLGLDSRSHLQTRPLLTDRAGQTAPVGGLSPSDLARAYDLGPLQTRGLTGANQTIAVPAIDTFRASDIASYDKAFGIVAPAVQVISVGGGATGHDVEATLDIEMLHAVAPHAQVLVYEGGQDSSQLAQILSRMVSDHRAQIISVSLGTCEGQINGSDGRGFVTALNTIFQQADAEGISVLTASGDSGAYDCQNNALSVDLLPASPYVTAVGGTTLFFTSAGVYGGEAGWEGPLEGAGSGGGLSRFFKRPAWQTGTGVNNSASNGMRQVPDVAADADPLSGYFIYASGWRVVGGTSAAAPLWAGLIALANQAATSKSKPPLGFLDPSLYQIGSGTSASQVFHDVTLGGNLYYQAVPGWDYATGWGSPDGARLVDALLAIG